MTISTTTRQRKRNFSSSAIIISQRNDGYLLFDRGDQKASPPWRSVRLINPNLRRGKRSYWLGWNTCEQRFARNVCLAALKRKPQLYDWALTATEQHFADELGL
jgi:hypothetical protein